MTIFYHYYQHQVFMQQKLTAYVIFKPEHCEWNYTISFRKGLNLNRVSHSKYVLLHFRELQYDGERL